MKIGQLVILWVYGVIDWIQSPKKKGQRACKHLSHDPSYLPKHTGMNALSHPLQVIGKTEDPFAGRAWRREFPHGDFELLYRSHAKSPSEIEKCNTWLALDGADYRIAPLKKNSSASTEAEQEDTPAGETNKERAARRARQKLRWLIKCIGADRLLTLTFRENVTEYEQAEKHLSKFLTRCRNEWGSEFKFAVVPERQKRGAWHFHLALRGFWNVNKLRAFWWRTLGVKVGFSSEGKPVMLDGTVTPGNVDITSPVVRGQKRRAWAIDRLASYLAKYVAKTLGTEDLGGKPSYRGTRGLHPSVQRYLVKALTFADVVQVFLASAACKNPFLFQSPDLSVLWCAGRIPPPQTDPLDPPWSFA